MSDDELERLKAKRLAEMQKNLSAQNTPDKEPANDAPKPREVLVKTLGYRGLEVLQNAEAQYPNETRMIVDKLGELILSGEVNEEIDGGKLLMLFRSVGLNIRMQTKINIEQDGKMVSLSDKLGQGKQESDE